MRVQICSKCKQPRKGHICPLWNEPSARSKRQRSDESDSQSLQDNVSPPDIALPTQPNSIHSQEALDTMNKVAPLQPSFDEVKQISPLHPEHNNSSLFQSNVHALNGSNHGPQVVEYSAVEENYQKKMEKYGEMSEGLMQRAAQIYKEDRAMIILYVTSTDPYQNAIKRFVSEPLKAETSAFQMVDRGALELIETCKNSLTASRDELLEILNERNRELAESRREIDQLKREISRLPSLK
ncbi:hypothetical protein K493DRAFT_320428 [Basidiobolus meristosporus CBS 931.73]|uniref:Uncharacterized protein n=1 Tax=Basidiobolus meristosporus CBS 931.73 TaxID=1314790 RepID=A0A1Y1XA05_9FUNG|nr:hypothetical protein K493DRAFT_320428 [Basidiobolus meristosporus CBS 931.73]|eukprot:ORX82575.1 hypothetical protein K493DRAFT_320428 [Basidiobolus meristosporus CBS 931.73]